MRHLFLGFAVLDSMLGAVSCVLAFLVWRRTRVKAYACYLGIMFSLNVLVGCFIANFYLREFLDVALLDFVFVDRPAIFVGIALAASTCAFFSWLANAAIFGYDGIRTILPLAVMAASIIVGSLILGPFPIAWARGAGCTLGACLAVSGMLLLRGRRRIRPAAMRKLAAIVPFYLAATIALCVIEIAAKLRFFAVQGMTAAPLCHACWSVANSAILIVELARGKSGTLPFDESLERVASDFGLSPREAEIVLLICEGMANKAIADRLRLAPRTVENYVYRLYRKLGVASRFELIRISGIGGARAE
jgi:DNA-binding CsgD family transcriptional regulator